MIAIAAATLRDLFAVVILFGIYSLMTAALFMDLDAVDVAFTEAAVGAGVSGEFLDRGQPAGIVSGSVSGRIRLHQVGIDPNR